MADRPCTPCRGYGGRRCPEGGGNGVGPILLLRGRPSGGVTACWPRARPGECWHLTPAVARQFAATCAALGTGPAARAALVGDLAGAKRDQQAAQRQAELVARYGLPKRGERIQP